MMSGYCFVLLFKLNYITLILKSAELVVFIPMAISRELCNLLCNSCPVNSLLTMYVSSADNLCKQFGP